MRLRPCLLLMYALSVVLPTYAIDCLNPRTSLTLNEYREVLSQIQDQLATASRGRDFAAIADCLPASWKVTEKGREISVSTSSLKRHIQEVGGQVKPEERQEQLSKLIGSLSRMQEQSKSYSLSGREMERAKLGEIMARREFAKLEAPGLMARIHDWFNQQVKRLLGAAIRGLPDLTLYFQILGWSLVLLAIALVSRFLLKLLWDDKTQMGIADTGASISAIHWKDWLAQARAASERQDWRDAIRFAYWGAISHLEREGCWPPDRARTPREYLRLLKEAGERKNTLSTLTRRFESAWYAGRTATEDDYREAVLNLEALGCR